MARTVDEIYNSIITEKEKYASLNNLTNTRNTSVWRSIYYSVAVAISVFEQLNDLFIRDLKKIRDQLPVGTRYWYKEIMLKFQLGYSLVYNRSTYRLEYPIIDEDAQIIAAASALNEGDNVVIKVAKYTDDTKSELTNLNVNEFNSVNFYLNDYKFAGVTTKLISLEADMLRLNIDIKVDKSLINNEGQSVDDENVYPVEDAINLFLFNEAKSDFDSTFKLQNLISEIKDVEGVLNLNVTGCSAKPTTAVNFLDILDTQFLTYQSTAGYIKIDSGYTLRDNINYV